MKVLLLCYEYPPIGGGGGIGAQQYAEAWVSSGHEVTVVTSRDHDLPRSEVVNGVHVVRVAAPGRRGRSTSEWPSMICYNVTALAHIFTHRRAFRSFHVINTHFSLPTGPMAAVAAWLLGLPNVLTIIGGDVYDPSKALSPHRHVVLRLLNHWIINAADRVVAISNETRSRAQQYYRVHQPIRVINYGFTPFDERLERSAEMAETTRPGDAFYLIAVGRLVARKGFDVLIRAIKHLPPSVKLRVVGDGPLEGALRTLAAKEGVSDRVELLGYRTRPQIHRLLRCSQCFVLSSHHEGLGIVVQEAMDAGLPIVATNHGGQVDLIAEGRNGLLVNPGNEIALADAVRRVQESPSLAESMTRNNRVDIRALYMDQNSRLYLDLFEDLAGVRAFRSVSVQV